MMISPSDIKIQVQKWEKSLFLSQLEGNSFFPKALRFKKIKSSDTQKHFEQLHESLITLKANSKEAIGKGYSITWETRNDRKIGKNSFPSQLIVETLADYFYLAGKEAHTRFDLFCEAIILIRSQLPQLEEWLPQHPLKVVEYSVEEWLDILKVCHYFLANPQPNLYLRELPIPIHTKFIEWHKGIINSLLQNLLPSNPIKQEFIGSTKYRFEERYGINYPEPAIRFRYLDHRHAPSKSFLECTVPISQFSQLHTACSHILITENELPFLTLPKLPNTLAIFGKGYAVNSLKKAHWLQQKNIYYWGDIDLNGFEILSNLRKHFPKVISLMMDWKTFNEFKLYQVHDPQKKLPIAERLTPEEQSLFAYLCTHYQSKEVKNRLEQEHVGMAWVKEKLVVFER